MDRKKIFKYYLYGYLNVYYNATRLLNGKSYKEHQVEHVVNYLHLKKRGTSFFRAISHILINLELPIGLFVLFVFFIKSLLLKPFKKRISNIKDFSLIYGLDGSFSKFVSLLNNADVDTKNLVVVTSPFMNNTSYKKYSNENILSRVSYLNMFEAFEDSVRMVFYMNSRYKKNDCFFRSYSYFEFILAAYYFYGLGGSNSVYFISLIERWAFLFGNLPNRTIFLQHGMMTDIDKNHFLIKIGKADVGYYMNDAQMKICNKLLFTNIPEAKFLKSMNFSHNEILKNNGKKNLLLICNYLYHDIEKTILLKSLDRYDVNLYVKPHPNDNFDFYRDISKTKPLIILDRDYYPKVDLVLSYDSSLAIEYENLGVNVIRYTSQNFENNLEIALS